MHLLSLPTIIKATAAVAGFDPTTLDFDLYVRASFSGAPWAGTASAGSSGGRDFTSAGADPSVGASQNGFSPAEGNGTTQYLETGGLNITNVLSNTAATII